MLLAVLEAEDEMVVVTSIIDGLAGPLVTVVADVTTIAPDSGAEVTSLLDLEVLSASELVGSDLLADFDELLTESSFDAEGEDSVEGLPPREDGD